MIKILFVCMGNICRSPSAEAVMKNLLKKKGCSNVIECDSAGTIAHHEGETADQRMQNHALKRGYNLTSIARKVKENDLQEFDYIIAMDNNNYSDLISLDNGAQNSQKISMMTDYNKAYTAEEVPDPYYGGPDGFEYVLDLLEDACEGLFDKIKKDNPSLPC